MDYKDVSWKMDYCCLNAHLSESSKELVVSFDIYIRLICITTITLSMSLFFSFLALLSYPFLFTEFFKTSALSPCQQKYLGEVFRTLYDIVSKTRVGALLQLGCLPLYHPSPTKYHSKKDSLSCSATQFKLLLHRRVEEGRGVQSSVTNLKTQLSFGQRDFEMHRFTYTQIFFQEIL